ncbi:type I-F CRISPR-associated helicase Cas3 [Betaproteobacteria bacterium]|nr:type I-F CRISPR-associated helicase Cas3 [Betaproteobacteria bacterium]
MNILLISQCEKRALTETRRILDQFAERRGERVWQTPITQAGLDTLRKLLRKTARKNTAVACHWIRGLDHSELIWIVGDASRFNAQGAVPTNTTRNDILRSKDENDWHTLEDIRLLAQMAALLHDLGKACEAFQWRLFHKPKETNLYRHEWVSLRLWQAFVGDDDDAAWLQRLSSPSADDDWRKAAALCTGLEHAPLPFEKLPPLAKAIGWLIVSHHRLPALPVFDEMGSKKQLRLGQRDSDFNRSDRLPNLLESMQHHWNERKRETDATEMATYWRFKHPLPVCQPRWRAKASKIATHLFALCQKPGKDNWLDNPYVMHLARLNLMLADHYYSALPPDSPERLRGDHSGLLFANTDKTGKPNQSLEEHLLGVTHSVASIAYALPNFARHLPHLARHRGLRQRSRLPNFTWQNKAADAAEALRLQAAEQGAFIINMASTGCGKTLANARIMYALADPQQGVRCTFALGLRTLTLQTGRSYRQDLHLDEDELAVRVGGSASRALFDYYQQQAEAQGSASIQELTEEDSHVVYEGQTLADGLLGKAMRDPHTQSLLSAPMLVCTIDHLMPATEAQRAGRQITPMLRLMSSDLALDELDDFDLADLPALTRLVHWAGMLGTRVLISSATLPPALVEGLYLAYRAGRGHYQKNRDQEKTNSPIACLWVDEFSTESQACADLEIFRNKHAAFVQKRVQALGKVTPSRRGELLPLVIASKEKHEIRCEFAAHVQNAILHAHDSHHEICPQSDKQISFGLVRMANIEPLFDVALELFRLGAPENYRIHLCVYHSRFPLLLRSAIERRLDNTLNRRKPEAVFAIPEIRKAIDDFPERHHLFVVLGSPVTEVGRDHDYDWAVVEPSSMRSLIQLAGRIQRHRNTPCPEDKPNILIFDTNLRHFQQERSNAAFIRPGFESGAREVHHEFRLITHRLGKLLRENEYKTITARPRIQPRPQTDRQPKQSLVDLEHARLFDTMLPKEVETQTAARHAKPAGLNAASAWQSPRAALTWALPQQQPFRDDSSIPETDLLFLPDEHDEQMLILHRIDPVGHGQPDLYTKIESYLEPVDLDALLGARISPWEQNDLLALLEEQAEAQDLSLRACAQRFTTVRVYASKNGWRYHPVLGFAKTKKK